MIVYWSCFEKEWLRAKEPVSIYNNFIKRDGINESGLQFCGGSKKYISKLYGIKSLYDYDFELTENGVASDKYNQEFFDEHVQIRSEKDKLFSFSQSTIFFTEEKSLEMSVGILPFLEDNNIHERCITIPGTLDIGKWFRSIDFAFYLKRNHTSFKVEENEIYQYIYFNTDKKITFKQFMPTQKLNEFSTNSARALLNRKKKNRPLENYYDMLKYKKHIIKEIKNNLI
jgi:hypothetical protein